MAGVAADNGQGATIVFGTSGFTGSLVDFSFDGVTRQALNTSHLGLADAGSNKYGNMTFIPSGLTDPGTLNMRVRFHTGQVALTGQPPIDEAAETITITWPLATGGSAAATWSFSGFCTSYGVTVPEDGIIEQSLSVKVSGNVTVVPAS